MLVICHNNKACHRVSFQANQNAAFVDERREFKIQWLSCRLTFPCPILLAASLADFHCQDTRANNTLPARRLEHLVHLTSLVPNSLLFHNLTNKMICGSRCCQKHIPEHMQTKFSTSCILRGIFYLFHIEKKRSILLLLG